MALANMLDENSPSSQTETSTSQIETGSSSPLSSLAYGLAGHAGAAGVDALASGVMSALAYGRQKKLMNKEYELQRKATKNLMSDERESYINAGLNPNLLAKGGFSAPQISAPTPAQQNVSGKGLDTLGLAQQKVLANTLEEQKVEIEGKRLENEAQKIENDRLKDEDETADMNARHMMENLLSVLPEDSDIYNAVLTRLEDDTRRFTPGTFKALDAMADTIRNSSSVSADAIHSKLDAQIYTMMLHDEETKKAIADAPKRERGKYYAYLNEVSSVISRNLADAALSGSQIDLNEQMKRKIANDIAIMNKEFEMRELQDSRWLIKQGRWHDFATNVLFNGFEFVGHTGESLAQGFAGGYGFSKGAAVAKGASPALSRNPVSAQSSAKLNALESGYKAAVNNPMSARELARLPLSERKKIASIEYNQFRVQHPRMGNKRLQLEKKLIGEKYGIFLNPQNKLRGK